MKIIFVSLILLLVLFVTVSASFPFLPNYNSCVAEDGGLLKTQWKQMGGFEKFTPDKLRLGCWSTALAQIVYYHQLKPFGQVQYISRQGYKINQKLDSLPFNFKLFSASIDSNTTEEAANEMARYNYYAALVVQKDFGTDRYMNKLAPARLFEKHFNVKAERFISFHQIAPYTLGKLEKVIYNELNEKRPVFLHFANLKDFGHSLVIDGYCYKDGVFMVHTNQGQGGPTDGWYNFYKGILRPDDNALRVVYTFKPQ
ncbi:C10 family peptidase [Adhaeribacter aquaticus]|uniref:C10 family peptidase n=1 Tax=Adhaeribacter aquaticus TaxID=299567 RepID=UPI000425E209|nr:C10 family peptidase [Adhaeribacter aquaticus]